MSAYKVNDTMVVVLTDRFHRASLAFPPATEQAIPLDWFDGGDVAFVPISPKLDRTGIVSAAASPIRPKESNLSAFFRGGNLSGQS